jgi:hypothetical protein
MDRRAAVERSVAAALARVTGRTELDVCLRTDHGWRGRYVPVDAWYDGVDLEDWTPPREADWFTGLEVLEHLKDPHRLVTGSVSVIALHRTR